MPAAAAMDSAADSADESCSNLGAIKGGGAALGISKTSAKINKSAIKKPTAAPKPVAKIYNADPSDFRRVVQELTGTNKEAVGAAAAAVRDSIPPAPRSSRLQRIAPPPLRHAIQASTTAQQTTERVSSLQPSLPGHTRRQQGSNPTSFGAFRHQQTAQNMRPLPMLSPRLFGPLPVLTPGDNAWANPLELATAHSGYATNVFPSQSVTIEGEGRGRSSDAAVTPQSPARRFPWSTAIWSPRFLPSPLPLSPNFLPHLSPSLFPPISPGFFAASGFPSPRTSGFGFGNAAYGGLVLNGAQLADSAHDFTFQGPNGVGANR